MKTDLVLETANAVDLKLIAQCDESVRERRRIELAIVRTLIRELIANHYHLKADNGEDAPLMGTEDELIECLFACDEARIETETGRWVFLVFGNDGWDVISDYSISIDHALDPFLEWTIAQQEKFEAAKPL